MDLNTIADVATFIRRVLPQILGRNDKWKRPLHLEKRKSDADAIQ